MDDGATGRAMPTVLDRVDAHHGWPSLLESIVEQLPHLVFVKDADDLRYVHLNRQAEFVFGVTAAAAVGRSDFDLFPPAQAAAFQACDREVLSEGRVLDLPAEAVGTPHGTRYLHTKKIPLLDPDGRPAYLLGIAEDITDRYEEESERLRQAAERDARIAQVLAGPALRMVFQPIVELASGTVVGAEALTRFDAQPPRPPDVWFAEAADAGRGVDLEVVAVEAALAQLPALPGGVYLSINASPSAVRSGRLHTLLGGPDAGRLVLELTEHVEVDDYPALVSALDELRGRGVRLAVDDAGAGFASLRHIVNLRPDIIKLDIGLTRGIDRDPARRALASALVGFRQEIGAEIVAEGIETREELRVLRSLGIRHGQGYFLGRPGGLPLPVLAADDVA